MPQISIQIRTFANEAPASWRFIIDQARAADVAGIDRVVVSDHVVFGEALDEYARPELGGTPGGKQPTGPDGHWLEPLTALSFIAAQTSRVRLGTNILLAALRRPVVLAKTTATLDVLSGGRLDLGVGVGWQRAEYDAAGLDFDRRAVALEQSLKVCETLWRDPVANFDDGDLRFQSIHQMPKPVQPGGIPIWVSGTVNPAMIRRLVRFGQGWIPWGNDARDLVESIQRMRTAVCWLQVGIPASIGVVGNLVVKTGPDGAVEIERAMQDAAGLIAAGVSDVRAAIAVPNEYEAALEVLSTLVGAFRAVSG